MFYAHKWQKFLESNLKLFDDKNLIFLKFESFSDHQDCFKYIEKLQLFKDTWVEKYLNKITENTSRKSSSTASQFKLQGNKYFKEKLFSKALNVYNQGIIATNQLEVEYNHCLANRSACYFHLDQYNLCINDLNECLKLNYKPKYKMLIRKVRCLLALKNNILAKEVLEDAFNDLKNYDENLEIKKIYDELKNLELKIDTSSNAIFKNDDIEASKLLPTVFNKNGNILKQASDAVEIRYDRIKGRYLIANTILQAGEIIIVEKPYVSLLLPSHQNLRCFHCLKKIDSFIPCSICNDIQFCNSNCQTLSLNQYHNIECQFLDLFKGIGIAFLAFRIVIVATCKNLLELFNKLSKVNNSSSGDANSIKPPSFYTCNYQAVYDLVHNSDKLHPNDRFQYAITANLLLKCLDKTTFFKEVETSADFKNFRNFIGSLLYRHICQLICNAHAITDIESIHTSSDVLTNLSLETPLSYNQLLNNSLSDNFHMNNNSSVEKSIVENVGQIRVATAIYPTASLMNHSCDPNIISSFVNDILVVRTVKDLKAGDEIFNCYGPHFKKMSQNERQKSLLEQYSFQCTCTACMDPDSNLKERLSMALLCKNCKGHLLETFAENETNFKVVDAHYEEHQSENQSKNSTYRCFDCGYIDEDNLKVKTLLFEEEFFKAIDLLHINRDIEAIMNVTKCKEIMMKLYHPMNKRLSELYDQIAKFYAIEGDYQTSAKYMEDSIKIVDYIYGKESIELAHELRKYSEVCTHALKLKEAKLNANRAKQIFALNYGQGHSSVLELNCLLKAIDSL